MCLYPKLIRNPKYLPNKKNGGQVPPFSDERVLHVPIGCGKCIECLKQKAGNWKTRLMEDITDHKNAIFVTLTFSNEKIEKLNEEIPQNITGYTRDNAIATLATRRFLERWRKHHKKSVRHWLVTELGQNGTENIHLHGLIYTDNPEIIKKHWQYGYVFTGEYVNQATINYIVKYIHKKDDKHKEYTPIILTSAGIGRIYTTKKKSRENEFKGEDTRTYYRTEKGNKIALPIYIRNKLYTEEEREKLWLIQLNKNVRYVLGQEIDVSKNFDSYFKILEEARKFNKKLGYGSDEHNWQRKKYENQLRQIKLTQRIDNNKNKNK